MTAECAECEKREKDFIAVRNEATELLLGGKITTAILERLKNLQEQELVALSAIMDHKIEHRLPKKTDR
jgi:hypothetical protein